MLQDEREVLEARIATLEEQLRKSCAEDDAQARAMSLLQATLEATTDGILVIDQHGNVLSCNRRFLEMWNIPQELLAARDDRKLLEFVLAQLRDPQEFLQKVEALYHQPTTESFDVLQFKDDRVFERYSRPQFLAGEAVGRVWSFRDITERRRAEQEAQRLRMQEQVIAAQAAALSQLSTPLIPISDQVVVMPLIGTVDAERAQQVLSTLLDGVTRARAHTAIVDITGVPVVDSHVAGALVRAAQATRLVGAEVILTGIRAEVAQTLVGLGIDLGKLITRSTLQSGINYALARQQRAAIAMDLR